MKISKAPLHLALLLTVIMAIQGCGTSVRYGFTSTSTPAKTINIGEFYNNADLGPGNMGQTFTNQIKNYFVQNTNISVVRGEGELQLEGEIVDLRLTPIAPVSTGDPNDPTLASATRVTITVKATYINTLDETMSFKDKSFSFYRDLPNEANLADIEEAYIRDIFDRIITDIFNASVANW